MSSGISVETIGVPIPTESRTGSARLRLDLQNPWPGLEPYDEESQALFFGREEEAAKLFRLIRLASLTTLWGRSGLGKSSLLKAGVLPRLRKEHFLPVFVRVDFTDEAKDSPLEQVARRLEEAVETNQVDCPALEEDETLWQYLHRRDLEFWSKDNFPLIPVFVFDQFEEIFTRSGARRDRTRNTDNDLADLFENCIPSELAEESSRKRLGRLDLSVRNYKVVLAFREDFVPQFEIWGKEKVPSLWLNYLRLLPMSRSQAILAISRAGKEVLDDGMAERIVDFVANREDDVANTEPAVEPVLLSLCCARLNRMRAPQGKIDENLLRTTGHDILEGFYREAIEGLPERVPRFIETQLIQGDRFRGSFPCREALESGAMTPAELSRLTDHFRLLRVDQQADTRRVELIHDRMVGVVRQARDERLARDREREQRELKEQAEQEAERERLRREQAERLREQAEAARAMERAHRESAEKLREQAEADRARIARMRNWLAGGVILASLFAVMSYAFFYSAEQAERRMDLLRAGHEARTMVWGSSSGGTERAMLQLVGVYRAAKDHLNERDINEGHFLSGVRRFHPLRKIITSGQPMHVVAFSPDGSRIAAAGEDGFVRLWDVKTGELVGRSLEGHTEWVWGLAFSPDGRQIISGGMDRLCAWEAERSKCLAKFGSDSISTPGVAFSGDGSRVVSAHGDSVKVWDAKTGDALGDPLKVLKDGALSVAFNQDGSRVVAGGENGLLQVWNVKTCLSERKFCEPLTLKGITGLVSAVAFNPDGNLVAAASYDKTIGLWDAATATLVGKFEGHSEGVTSVAFSHDGGRIVSGSEDRTIRIWDVETRRPLGAPILGNDDTVWGVTFSPDGSRIASAGEDNSIRLWDASESQSFGIPLGGDSGAAGGVVWSVAISPDGSRIVTGEDNKIRRWDAWTGQELGKAQEGHEGPVLALAFSPDGRHIASGGYDESVRVWNAETGEPIGVFREGHEGSVTNLAYSPDGARIVSGGRDGKVYVWNAKIGRDTGKALDVDADLPITSVAFSGDGGRIVAGTSAGSIFLWNAQNGERLNTLEVHEGVVWGVALTGDDHLFSASADSRIQRLNLRNPDVSVYSISPRKTRAVFSIALNSDHTIIVSGGDDNSVRLWDAESGRSLAAPLVGHRGSVLSVAISADDRRIVSGSTDNTARLWPGPAQWPDEFCAKLTRNMSRKEWRNWVSEDVSYVCQCPGLPISPDDPFSIGPSSARLERCPGSRVQSMYP